MTQFVQADNNKPQADRNKLEKLDRMLDIALALSFPASDPVAITMAANHPSGADEMRKVGVRTVVAPKGKP